VSARGARGRTSAELDARQAEVLWRVIQEHTQHGQPVGSVSVARDLRQPLSPATVRAIMAELTELGLLSQPHTSAGRVPTDRAYRLYVDHILRRPPVVGAAHALAIDRALERSRTGVPEMLGEASRQLSHLSNQVGLVLAPELSRILVDRLEFARLEGRRVMAILVGRSGVVRHRILEVREALEQPELDRITHYLSTELGGRTLPEMRDILQRKMSEERAAVDRLLARSLELGRSVVELEISEAELFVGGASNLLQSPEFSDPEVVRGLFRTLEEKAIVVDLLTRVLEGEGVQVVIGEENPRADLCRCSVVASSYAARDRVIGTVAIVGPTRMEYEQAVALVDYLSRVLTRLLSGPGN
jgi:heat-inducible transcriptional repressor